MFIKVKRKIKNWIIKKITSEKIIELFFLWQKIISDKYYKSKLKSCGENVNLRYPLVLEGAGNIEIGDNVSFASYVHIWGLGGVKIGSNTMIASHVAIFSLMHDYSKEKMHETLISKPIVIGRNVWIGTHAIIFPGVTIGDEVVIGANTIVKHDIPENAIFYGNPGKIISYRNIKK